MEFIIMQYDTDKFASGLIDDYLKLLWPYKAVPFKILEVGIYKGGFLHWIYDNFSNAQIFGIDLKLPPATLLSENDRTSLFEFDQNNIPELHKIGIDHGPFDFVIDDGLHRTKEIQNTFAALWQFVKPGGWYIIEDWAAGYKRPFYDNPQEVIAQIILTKERIKGLSEFEIICRPGDISIAKFRKLTNLSL